MKKKNKSMKAGIWNDHVKHFFLLNFANVAFLMSIISVRDAKVGNLNEADLKKLFIIWNFTVSIKH